MTITYVAASSLASGTGARDIDKPAGVVEGDLMLLWLCINQSNGAPSVPGDWTLVDQETGATGIYVYRKLAGASEGANYSVNASNSANYTPAIVAWHSDDGGAILEVEDSATQANASSTNREYPSVTSGGTGRALACMGSLETNFSSAADAAMTERLDTGTSPRLYLMTQTGVGSGATGTRTATGAGATVSKTASVLVAEGTEAAPDAPSDLVAVAFSDTRIDLSWTDNSDNETGFVLERSPDGSTGWAEVATPIANSVGTSNIGLTASTTYYYRIKATNGGGDSAYSNTANATTEAAPLDDLVAPTGLAIAASGQQELTLTWTDANAVLDGVAIERSPNGTTGWAQIDTVADGVEEYVDLGLQADTEYFYRVRAYRDS